MNITATKTITDTTRTGMRTAGKATARVGETLQRSGRIKTLPGQARRTTAAFVAGWRAGRRTAHVAQDRAKPGIGVAAGAVAGLGAGFFLDPQNGKRRRHVVRDKAASLLRRGARESHRKADYAAGAAKGAAQEAMPAIGAPADPNDQTLQQKVQSEIFRDPDAPKGSVNVNVERGVVYLRGEVPERTWIERLVASARGVQGVKGVESLLHQPDEPAPKKE